MSFPNFISRQTCINDLASSRSYLMRRHKHTTQYMYLFQYIHTYLNKPLSITRTQGRGGGRAGGGGIPPSNVCSGGGGGTVLHSSRRARGGIGPSGIVPSGNRKDNGIWPPPNATG